MPLFRFNKNYKGFKRGQQVELPDRRFTGQIEFSIYWDEVKFLLKKHIVTQCKK